MEANTVVFDWRKREQFLTKQKETRERICVNLAQKHDIDMEHVFTSAYYTRQGLTR